MNLTNATKMEAGYTLTMRSDGRELLVVVAKGTFLIPKPGEEACLADKQMPLVTKDVFSGEPAFSAPLYEVDFVPRKPRCDVLLHGSAYAPRGRPVDRLTVSLRVGRLQKSFDVVGNRVWQTGSVYMAASDPEPFVVMPISYNNAFGGIDRSQEDPIKWQYYPFNYAGVGYHENTSAQFMNGKPLPNTEETGRRINNPKGNYRPMAFGPVGRTWEPRPKLAGTYDQHWLDHVFPFLPTDFKDEYYQSAPVDQQTDYLRGGEEVELTNLTPEGLTRFRIPNMHVPITILYRIGKPAEIMPVIDTLIIEPDNKRFLMTWRAALPLRRSIHEVREVIVGKPPREPDSDFRTDGKRQFETLEELAQWRRSQGAS